MSVHVDRYPEPSSLDRRRRWSISLGVAVSIAGAARPAAANTVGAEWELTRAYAVRMDGENDVALGARPKQLICTTAQVTEGTRQFPRLTVSYDLGDPHAILELITAPIEITDAQWTGAAAGVIADVDTFAAAVTAECTQPRGYRCTVASVLARLGGTWQRCPGTPELTDIYFGVAPTWLTNVGVATPRLAQNTQVNLAIDLPRAGIAAAGGLYTPNDARTESPDTINSGAIRTRVVNRLAALPGWGDLDADSKGFLAWYFTSMSFEAARTFTRNPEAAYAAYAVTDWHVKNLYDLLSKAPLNALWAVVNFKTRDATAAFLRGIDDDQLRGLCGLATQREYCGDLELATGLEEDATELETEANDDKDLTLTPPKREAKRQRAVQYRARAQEIRLRPRWLELARRWKKAIEDVEDPVGLAELTNVIAPFRRGENQNIMMVVESRLNENPVNTDLSLTLREGHVRLADLADARTRIAAYLAAHD